MSLFITRGSGKNRRTVEVPSWQAKSHRDACERVREDVKALVTRPATFGNFSGGLS